MASDVKRVKKNQASIWMPLYIGDYLSDTTRLTTEQHGAYLLLIMDYWVNGAPPDDDAVLAQITKLSPAAWSNARSTLRAFFEQKKGRLIHRRIEAEKEAAFHNAEKRSGKAQAAAFARWSKNHQGSDATSNASSIDATSNAQSNAPAMLEICPSPSPSPSPSKPNLSKEVILGGTQGVDPETGELLDPFGEQLRRVK